MRLRHALRAVFLGLSVTTLSFAAAADTAGAQTFVEKETTQIRKLVEANAPPADVTKVIDGMVDFKEIAMRSLGHPCPASIPACTDHWVERSDKEKAELTELFRGVVVKKVRDNAYKTKDFEVSYKGAKDLGSDITRVKTEAHNKTKPRDPPVQVDYMIRCPAGATVCTMIDSVHEGSILTKNYYDQAHKILTTAGQGYPYLTQKLREKAKPGSTEK